MSAILTTAPACFSHPLLLGQAGVKGVEYIAVGPPDISRVIPKSKPPEWGKLMRFGERSALEIGDDTYVEVRAFRGAFFDSFSTQSGTSNSWATGAFVFPADKPYIVGAYKCSRELDWAGDLPNIRRNELSIASLGRAGRLISYNSGLGRAGTAPQASNAAFASCLAMIGTFDTKDELGKLVAGIEGVGQRAVHGAGHLFGIIFGSGHIPRFTSQIRSFVPENATSGYSEAVPLKRPKDLRPTDTYIGYDLRRSRFVDLWKR